MRRFWSLALAILFLISSLAAAEPLTASDSAAGSSVRIPDPFYVLPSAAQEPTLNILEPDLVETQPDVEESPLPDVQSIPGEILRFALNLLDAQDFSLSLEEVYDGSRMELTLRRLDADQLEICLSTSDADDMRIVLGAEGFTFEVDGASVEYSYEEVFFELLSELAYELDLEELLMNVYVDGTMQDPLDLLLSLIPSAEDEAFLMQLFEIAVDELAHAGLDFEPLETYDGAYFHLELSPKLLCNAIVRFVDRALEYEDEIDALLAHYDAPLRALLPELFEIYNPLTKQNVQRAAYTCAELKIVWQYARQELLGQRTDDAGATLDIYADDSGACRLNLQIRDLPDGGGAVFVLDFDEDGNASGTLTLMQSAFNYDSGRYETAMEVFDIELSMLDGGMMLRVTPRTPSEGFSLLTANLFFSYDGTAFDLTTDALRLRLHADSEGLCGSLEFADAFSADLNLAVGEELHGSLILSEDGYNHVLRLNE